VLERWKRLPKYDKVEQTKQLQKVSTIIGIIISIGIVFFGAVKFAYNSGINFQTIKSDSEKIVENKIAEERNRKLDKARTDRVVKHSDEKAKMRDEISHLKLKLNFNGLDYETKLREKDLKIEILQKELNYCKNK